MDAIEKQIVTFLNLKRDGNEKITETETVTYEKVIVIPTKTQFELMEMYKYQNLYT